MKQYIGCDLHRDYSVFASVDENGRVEGPWRVEHERERAELRKFLRRFPGGTPVAVETTGSWYWMIDELEAAGLQPMLANSYEARQRMRGPHKTDPLDARGLATLLRNGTLPSVWIPTAKLRDLRALMRTRLALVAQRTTIKNRIVAAVNRYGLIHTVLLYRRLKQHKCHGKAAVAVARHLAESTWWILKHKQPYREPVPLAVSSSTHGQARRSF